MLHLHLHSVGSVGSSFALYLLLSCTNIRSYHVIYRRPDFATLRTTIYSNCIPPSFQLLLCPSGPFHPHPSPSPSRRFSYTFPLTSRRRIFLTFLLPTIHITTISRRSIKVPDRTHIRSSTLSFPNIVLYRGELCLLLYSPNDDAPSLAWSRPASRYLSRDDPRSFLLALRFNLRRNAWDSAEHHT